MDNLRTYFALVKAYMAINILLTPRSFVNGGYLLSPFALIIACAIESFGSVRIIHIAKEKGIFSYPLLMKEALGDKGFFLANIFLALAHW